MVMVNKLDQKSDERSKQILFVTFVIETYFQLRYLFSIKRIFYQFYKTINLYFC